MSIQTWVVSMLVLAAAALGGGCGGGSATSAAGSTPGLKLPCRAGSSWEETGGRRFALACSAGGGPAAAALVGHALAGVGCVSVYAGGTGEPFDELCEEPPSRWTVQCEGGGCVHYFAHGPKSTVLDGPVEAAATSVRVLVEGRPLRQGVIFAAVRGKLMHAIRASEPFGFFAVSIPRCVDSDQVRVEMLGPGRKRLGDADQWDVGTKPCRGPGRA